MALFCGLPAFGVQSVTLSWNASADPTVVGYKIYYGTTSGVYPNSVDAGGATNVTITGLADGSTNYFAGTTYDSATNESPYSAEVAYVAPVTMVSTTPLPPATNNALNVISGLTVTVDPGFSNSVALSWNPTTDTVMAGYLVSYGPAGASPTVVPAWQHTSLVVTGLVAGVTNYFAVQEYDVSWNLGPMSPFASYCFPLSSGSVSAPTNTPTTTVTNTTPVVTNSTPTTTNTSPVTTPTNTPPTLNALPGILLNINSSTQTVLMTGISSGLVTGNHTNKISVTSSKTGLIPTPVVSYQSPNSTGNLLFKPKSGQTGTATITVTVNNGGASNNIVTKSFVVTVINFADLPKITRTPAAAAALAGKNIALSVGASGQSLKYQWKFNGMNLPGATSSTLNLKKVIAADTGAYSVQISNSLGITNSLPAVVTVITNTAPILSTPVQGNGQFSFEVSGVPGGKYVIEASADLQHWSPVTTNTAPFTYNDTKVAGYNQKFYRSYYVEPK
ncbi:MAG TPA: hypothetical protein VK742_00225 [Candidatus Sulfotelmatobacter sp.]|nr:hypothetical protein [Candidatus Sulfotelmatobacter sp.]